MAKRLRDDYVVGMWRRSIEHQLLWSVEDTRGIYDNSIAPRPVVYRAPSWSWASIDRPILTNSASTYEPILFKAEDVRVLRATKNATGNVTGGYLDLRGSLRPTRLLW